MAATKTFNGRLESLCEEIQNSIKSIIEKEKYKKYEIAVNMYNTLGNNLLGELYLIDITGEAAEGEKSTNIFVKQRLPLENFKLLQTKKLYLKEVFIYKDLSKVFTSLQDEANVPQEERYRIAKAYEETNYNFIILENLTKKGFRMYGKTKVVPIKYAQIAIKEMAKFHALGFVIEEKMPEYFNNKIKVEKSLFVFNDDWAELIRNICRHAASLYDSDLKKKIENYSSAIIENLPKYYNDQTSVRCTLNHGDFKKNNLLVRTQGGEVVEVVPVDYQLMFYGCPIMDFFLFIFSSTDRELRKEHLNDLKELYFETLTRFLEYFDMDVEAVYPRMEFERVYKKWLDFGLMMTLYFSFVICTPDAEVNLEDVNLLELPLSTDKKYDYFFRDLIDDFIDRGYL